jgi:hypothetical protein
MTDSIPSESEWLIDAISEMIGTHEFLTWFDPSRGPRGCLIVQWAAASVAIEASVIESRDAVALSDCFSCAKCGLIRVPDSRNVYRIRVGGITRTICETCYFKIDE